MKDDRDLIETMDCSSNIASFYKDKTIFITGCTGFMGKVLGWKLLRSCPVKKIFILMRPKNGLSMEQRKAEMFGFELFNDIKASRPEVLQKVVPVMGDITQDGLGISEEDKFFLTENVNIIFHLAATINFQEPLRVAVNMNMLGVKRVVVLAQQVKNLQALIHVSTAYVNCPLSETIYENMLEAPMKPEDVIKLVEENDDAELAKTTADLIKPWPNTYSFTKCLAEHLFVREAEDLPICIVRPSIVCGAWREPVPGWVDNKFAFTGLLLGMGVGAVRSLYVKKGITADFIPVDISINLMIAAAFNVSTQRYDTKYKVPIYNCSSGFQKPLTIEKLQECIVDTVRRYPMNNPVLYPGGSAKYNEISHRAHMSIVCGLPAHVYDFVQRLQGRRPIAVVRYNKMMKAIDALQYFMLRNWTFHNENVQGLWNSISSSDKKDFNFSIDDLHWSKYIDDYQLGCKKFILKEGVSYEALEAARTNMSRKEVQLNSMSVVIYSLILLLFLFVTMWIIGFFPSSDLVFSNHTSSIVEDVDCVMRSHK